MPLIGSASRTTLREIGPPGFDQSGRWRVPVDRFKDMVDAIINDPATPPKMANAAMAALWLAQAEAFREGEENLMLKEEYDHRLEDHRVFLSDMIANGEALVAAVRKEGMAPTKFTLEDLLATLNSLHSTFECEHRSKNSPKTNEFIATLFDGSKS
jgi:hypothetical protein